MPEYIEREALKKAFKEKHDSVMQNEMYSKQRKWHEALGYSVTLSVLENAPTVDVVEVRHGEWKHIRFSDGDIWNCSECKTLGDTEWEWCPHCGAKME